MKTARKFCVTALLALTLALSVSAGDMSGPGTQTPTAVTGDMSGPGTRVSGEVPDEDAALLDPVTSLTLSLLESLRSRFF